MSKHILVIAQFNIAEALRVAVGLTLLHDGVRVISVGPLPDDPVVREQREALDFVEVPCLQISDPAQSAMPLATAILAADLVYRL